MRVLGIETSCDETAAAVVEGTAAGEVLLLANVVSTQVDTHAAFGGVVPEVASREHVTRLVPVIEAALRKSQQRDGALGAAAIAPVSGRAGHKDFWRGIDAIAVTQGPGLAGALLVGLQVAKGLALGRGLPWLGVHHLEGHLAAASIAEAATPARPTARVLAGPHLACVISGGHSHFYAHRGIDDITLVAATRDDAAGEAFDKVAKLIGLGYPGGPAVERAAAGGRKDAFALPRALPHDDDLSFSGLKTAAQLALQRLGRAPTGQALADFCASLQEAIAEAIARKAVRAARRHRLPGIVLGGGVAANGRVRACVAEAAHEAGLWTFAPPKSLCTDNAAMIAAAGLARLLRGERSPWSASARPRWPLARAHGTPAGMPALAP